MKAKGRNTARVKEFLRTIREEQNELENLEEQLDKLRLSFLPKAITYDKDRVQTPASDPMADKMAEVLEIEQEIRSHLQILNDHRAQAMRIIRKIRRPAERTLLELYYIGQGGKPLTWEDVAKRMNYSIQTIYDIHGKALLSFEKLYHTAKKRATKKDSY